MATYTIAAGKIAKHAVTMVAAQVDTYTFTDDLGPGQRVIEVMSDGAADIYYTLDGSTPTVGGDNCYRIPATPAVDVRLAEYNAGTSKYNTVKMISSGTPVVSVQRGGRV